MKRKQPPRTFEFYESIVHDRDVEKLTYQAIATKHGVTRQRVEQAYWKGKYLIETKGTDPFWGLPARAVTLFNKLDLRTKAQVMKAVKKQEIHPHMGEPNFCWKSYNAIREWLGLPPAVVRRGKLRVCPNCGHHF